MLIRAYFTRRKLRRENPGKVFVYLSGNIDGLSYDKAMSWRHKTKESLGEKFFCLEFPELKDHKGDTYLSPAEIPRDKLRGVDLELLFACDIVLMQLNDGMLTIGTIKEDFYAFWFKRKVIIWSSLRKVKESSWIDSTNTVFDTLDECIKFITKNCDTRAKIKDLPTHAPKTKIEDTMKNVPSIIICGDASCGKSTLAKRLANHLEMKFVDGGDALKELASLEGYENVEGKDWWDTEKGMEFHGKRETDPSFDYKVDDIMKVHADAGAVLTTWTLGYIYFRPSIKIWLNTSKEQRVARLAKRDKTDLVTAREAIEKRDFKNRAHYKKLYGFDFGEDLSPFHIVIDGDMSADEIFHTVLKFVKKSESTEA